MKLLECFLSKYLTDDSAYSAAFYLFRQILVILILAVVQIHQDDSEYAENANDAYCSLSVVVVYDILNGTLIIW